MAEAGKKLKYILFVDAILFLLCAAGTISVEQKAKLPFDLTAKDSLFSIIIPKQNSYNLSDNDVLLSVEGKNIYNAEKPEIITDRKNIGDIISISILTNKGTKYLNVRLINFYSPFYIISTTTVALFFFIIAVFVLIKKSEEKVAHIFHWTSIGIAIMMCLTWSNLNTFPLSFSILLRIVQNFAYVLVPPLFVHFTLVFPRDNSTKWKDFLYLYYSIAIVLGIIINYLFIHSLNVFNDNSTDNFLIVFSIIRICLIVGVILSISFFVNAFRKEKGKTEREQLKWVLLGFLIGPLSFVVLWVLPILFTGKALVPEEVIMILLCSVPITFTIAIVKHHLLNIDEVLNRSIVYSIVIIILLIIYSVSIGIFVYYFHIANQSIVSAIATVILAVFFQPFKTKVQQIVDKKFFRVQYNFREELNKFVINIKNYNDINSLGEYLIREIDFLIPVEKIAFSEIDEKTGKLYIKSQKNFDNIANKSLRIKSGNLESKGFQVAASKNKVETEAKISTIFQNTLIRWKISLVIPIKSVKNDLYGFILLGSKKSGSRFSTEDVDLLKDVGINAAATIERIKLQEQLIREKFEGERLEELNRQKSMFVSTVSHDLKTPLTSIKIFAEMLLENEKSLTDKSKNYIEIIEGETDRLTRLINNVLDFSKIEKGVKEYFFREIYFNKTIKSVIELMKYTLDIQGFKLESSFMENDVIINADADAIIQAVENLISNAVRFSSTVKSIKVHTYLENNFACISVQDSGMGIDEKDLKNIFDPFFRSEIAKRKKIEGTGLGLPIIKHIIDQHKGEIHIESTPGKGSIFTLCLPILPNN
jgi:signal transduction histidine kinase